MSPSFTGVISVTISIGPSVLDMNNIQAIKIAIAPSPSLIDTSGIKITFKLGNPSTW